MKSIEKLFIIIDLSGMWKIEGTVMGLLKNKFAIVGKNQYF